MGTRAPRRAGLTDWGGGHARCALDADREPRVRAEGTRRVSESTRLRILALAAQTKHLSLRTG